VAGRSRGSARKISESAKRTSLLVFTEGSKTEPLYLTHWHRLYRERVIIQIAKHQGTSPFELVERAAEQRSMDLREERRGRGDAYNQYWCVFDVDEHPKIPDALKLAEANAINLAISGPCIELWFLIHFDPHTSYIERSEAKRRAYAKLGCGKTLSLPALAELVDLYPTARSHAQSLETKHSGDASPQPWNPSSGLWRLIDVIRA
jgi:hypothetical protein